MRKVAFLFPGQGAQYVGMGKELYDRYEAARDVFQIASDALHYDVKRLCFEGPEDELKKTEITQPTILTVSIAALEVLKYEGISPEGAAGLSLGEYGAWVAAGTIKKEDAIPLVKKRGRYMQEAVPLGVGTMAAIIGLDREKVLEACDKAKELGVVEAANFNCPGQIVISGVVPAVEKACLYAKEFGAKRAMVLPVSAPFHSSLLKPAGENLKRELENINFAAPVIPVIANVTAHETVLTDEIKELLIKQVSSPVMWEDSMNRLIDNGYDTFIEVGPGKALNGFMKKINKNVSIFNVEDISSLEKTLAALRG